MRLRARVLATEPASRRARSILRSAGAALLGLVTACGYTSEYIPPDNWRVRPVYSGDDIIAVGPGAAPRCPDEVAVATSSEPSVAPIARLDSGGYWAPRVNIHVLHGLHPHPIVHPLHLAHAGGHGGSGGFDTGGWSPDDGDALAVLLILALVTSSAIAVTLAAAPVESSVARTIDGINEFNDRARQQMLECGQDPAGR